MNRYLRNFFSKQNTACRIAISNRVFSGNRRPYRETRRHYDLRQGPEAANK
jgi:hypothetical protein